MQLLHQKDKINKLIVKKPIGNFSINLIIFNSDYSTIQT